MNVWIEGMTVKVTTTARDLSENQLKHIAGGRFDSKKKCWSFPFEQYDQLVEMRNRFSGHMGLKPVKINSRALLEMGFYLEKSDYSPNTIRNYQRYLASFLKFAAGKSDPESVQRYLTYLEEERHLSATYVRNAVKSINLYIKIIEKK